MENNKKEAAADFWKEADSQILISWAIWWEVKGL
jgi:hypothetical protein